MRKLVIGPHASIAVSRAARTAGRLSSAQRGDRLSGRVEDRCDHLLAFLLGPVGLRPHERDLPLAGGHDLAAAIHNERAARVGALVDGAAQQALDTNNLNRVLIWVQPSDEAEIKNAFSRVRAVRALNPLAKDFADNYFFETLVRVYSAGEGAPHTGIKPAGLDLGPAIPAGDKALVTGSVEPVVDLLAERIREGIAGQFRDVVARKDFKTDDVAAGQQYVKSYVEYIHAVERVSQPD